MDIIIYLVVAIVALAIGIAGTLIIQKNMAQSLSLIHI